MTAPPAAIEHVHTLLLNTSHLLLEPPTQPVVESVHAELQRYRAIGGPEISLSLVQDLMSQVLSTADEHRIYAGHLAPLIVWRRLLVGIGMALGQDLELLLTLPINEMAAQLTRAEVNAYASARPVAGAERFLDGVAASGYRLTLCGNQVPSEWEAFTRSPFARFFPERQTAISCLTGQLRTLDSLGLVSHAVSRLGLDPRRTLAIEATPPGVSVMARHRFVTAIVGPEAQRGRSSATFQAPNLTALRSVLPSIAPRP